jgi:hypothetical protein
MFSTDLTRMAHMEDARTTSLMKLAADATDVRR